MSRPLRIEIENGLYHVTARGWERRRIVESDGDREDWLRLLDRVAFRSNWRVFAWVLMSNHFHLFLRTIEPNLSAGMHDLNSGYASLFNRRRHRVGSLFQGRFKAVLVENDSHAWELSRYVHLNPVRAKMVKQPAAYRWSSYPVYCSARHASNAPAWLDWKTLLLERSKNLGSGRRAYRRFVEQANDPQPTSPLLTTAGGCLLGSPSWIETMRVRLAGVPGDANLPQHKQLAWRPSSADILRRVEAHFGVASSDFVGVGRHGNDARTAAVYLIRRLTNNKVTTIAEQFGGVSLAAISKLVRRAQSRRNEDIKWDRLLTKLQKDCQKEPNG